MTEKVSVTGNYPLMLTIICYQWLQSTIIMCHQRLKTLFACWQIDRL